MSHDWYDGDIDRVCVERNIYLRVLLEDDVDEIHITEADLQEMYKMLCTSKLEEVKPTDVTTKLSRDDIIMLAKAAGLTKEDLK